MFSYSLILYHAPIVAAAVKSALNCLILLSNCRHCIRSALLSCKDYLVFVVIAFVFFRSFALHYPLITAMAMKSALGCLVLLSNCRHCIRSASLNCKGYLVFLLLLLHCGISVFCRFKCQLNLFHLRLRINLKRNRSLITSKNRHGQRGRFLFVSTQSHFSPNSSSITQTGPADLPLM